MVPSPAGDWRAANAVGLLSRAARGVMGADPYIAAGPGSILIEQMTTCHARFIVGIACSQTGWRSYRSARAGPVVRDTIGVAGPIDTPASQKFKERHLNMRILVALAVVVVFAAMFVFDTAALVRLTAICVTGGCGVPPMLFAVGGGGIALAALLSLRRPVANVKTARVTKTRPSRPSRAKAGARRKPKPAKQSDSKA